jgi:acyl-coenzyme A thioesterase PaaI-like protein
MTGMTARWVEPLVERGPNVVREAWDRLNALPGGKTAFTRLVMLAAPYTGTIPATVLELERGFSRVEMRDRRSVRNHLQCVHAIALANLAELTGNVALAYTLPDDARFIVAGMSLDYLKKARGTITGTCTCPPITSSAKHELDVPVELRDSSSELVVRATLRSLVGPKKRR